MKYLLADSEKILRTLRNSSHLVLLADYDGTLTPIVERPELAQMSENNRKVLKSLAGQPKLTFGIISGRSLSDLKNLVGVSGIVYAGNHGLEIEGPDISYIYPVAEEIKLILRVLHQLLNKALSLIRGVIIEDKGLAISVHYRQVEASQVAEVKKIFSKIVSGLQVSRKVKITHGKKVIEIRPAVEWHKGKALQCIIKLYGKGGRRSGVVPLYFGDDTTDEDAFRQMQKYENGITVFVGDKHQVSAAEYYLNSTDEVYLFLEKFLCILR